MKKIFSWIKKRIFVVLLFAFGICYLTYTDNWQLYTKPVVRAGDRCKQFAEQVKLKLEEEILQANSKNTLANNEWAKEHGLVGMPGIGEQSNKMKKSASGASSINMEGSIMYAGLPEGFGEETYITVGEDYFADALFIGDSRTVGLCEYGGLGDVATFYASTGLNIYKLMDASIVEVPGQKQKISVDEALQENKFSRIYLMIGINEMGTGTVKSFMDKYKEVVARIQELQPDAKIILQGIMKVTTERSEKGDYIHNEGIEERNAEIAKLADDVTVFYLDVNPYICDEDGGMEASYTYDGVHLKAQYTSIWTDYLKSHGIP